MLNLDGESMEARQLFAVDSHGHRFRLAGRDWSSFRAVIPQIDASADQYGVTRMSLRGLVPAIVPNKDYPKWAIKKLELEPGQMLKILKQEQSKNYPCPEPRSWSDPWEWPGEWVVAVASIGGRADAWWPQFQDEHQIAPRGRKARKNAYNWLDELLALGLDDWCRKRWINCDDVLVTMARAPDQV